MLRFAGGHGDAREFVIKHYNWKRVAGNNIESNKLLPEDFKIIYHGLNEIIEQEGYSEYDDNLIEQMEFNISTYTGQRYTMTLAEIGLGGKKLPPKPTAYDSGAATRVAANNIKKIELDKMHPSYKQLGDWAIYEAEYQKLFPYLSDEEPLSDKDLKKLSQYKNKEDYVKAMSRGGRQTQKAAQAVAMAFVGGFYLGSEEVVKIYDHAIEIPEKKFITIIRPKRYVALVHLRTTEPNMIGNYTNRLIAIWQGAEGTPITKESILDNDYPMLGSIVFQNNYITHAYVDPQYKSINLYGQMRDFLRKYYGIVGTHPEDNLKSKHYLASDAKHKWNKFIQQKQN